MKVAWISAVCVAFVCFFQHGDAAITGWTEPSITGADGAGTLFLLETQATSTTITTFAATTDATATYSLPTAVSPFAVASTGELTITAALDFATTPSYTLKIEAVDDATPPATGTATITVVQNVAPAFATSYSPCLVDGSPVDTTVVTVSATDANSGDGDTVTYGLSGTDFKIDTSTGLIQVKAGTTIDKATTPSYDIVVTATDTGTLSATTTVSVTVADSCSSAMGVAVSLMALLATLLVNIF
ncbi:protocadherin beta-4-like [Mercenaria mercenaria]|uniref:protocadherin beta-4-like n=1 Tax=Mercenaria mercenaria TaxID=6596 RepID=UPI00234E4776|nr:protocadherin beta-4-like [Mercenaria mercenaria]